MDFFIWGFYFITTHSRTDRVESIESKFSVGNSSTLTQLAPEFEDGDRLLEQHRVEDLERSAPCTTQHQFLSQNKR